MTPKTVARIASISKPLTMVAVAKLVEDGKIDLDKKVTFCFVHFFRFFAVSCGKNVTPRNHFMNGENFFGT